jgi:hypothetical protein
VSFPDLLFKKKGTRKYLAIWLFAFWSARDHPRPKDAEQLKSEIIEFMKGRGYELDWPKY